MSNFFSVVITDDIAGASLTVIAVGFAVVLALGFVAGLASGGRS